MGAPGPMGRTGEPGFNGQDGSPGERGPAGLQVKYKTNVNIVNAYLLDYL